LAADRLLGSAPGFGLLQALLLGTGAGLCGLALLAPGVASRVLLGCASVLVGLLLAEIGLRTFVSRRLTGNLRPHPRYLFDLRPRSMKYETRLPINGGETNLVQVNSSGFRGNELLVKGAAIRVVVYGDSFIEAEFSDLSHTFVWLLQEKLTAELARPVEVINAGVRAYGPDQVSLRVEDELPRLEPRVVLVALYAGNDFGDLLRNKLYTVASEGTVLLNAVGISDSLARQFRLAQPGGLYLVKLVRQLAALRKFEPIAPDQAVAWWIAEKNRMYRDAIAPGRKTLTTLADPYDIDVSTEPESPEALYQKTLMQATLRRIRDSAARHGCRLLVMIIPSPIDICDDCGTGKVDSSRFQGYRPSALSDAIHSIASREGIEVINLFAPQWNSRASTLYFHGGDEHWNDRGQAVAAQMVGQYIIDRGMLRGE
jgi:hypothetical protein